MEHYDAAPQSTGSIADDRLHRKQCLAAGFRLFARLLTVGQSVEAAIWWFIAMERSCQTEPAARAVGDPRVIGPAEAQKTRHQVGSPMAGWFSFQPLGQKIVRLEPAALADIKVPSISNHESFFAVP